MPELLGWSRIGDQTGTCHAGAVQTPCRRVHAAWPLSLLVVACGPGVRDTAPTTSGVQETGVTDTAAPTDSSEPSDSDPGVATTHWEDRDEDGYGDPKRPLDPAYPVDTGDRPHGVTNDMDCDDGDPDIHPGQPETCNGLDDDCDNDVDEEVCLDVVGLESAGVRIQGTEAKDGLGAAVVVGSDATGDGVSDLLIAAAGHRRDGVPARAFLVQGPLEGEHDVSSAMLTVTLLGSEGTAPAAAWLDVAMDGLAEVVLGAPHQGEGGVVLVVGQGVTGPVDSDALTVVLSAEGTKRLGVTIVAGASLGEDGHPALVAGDGGTSSRDQGDLVAFRGPGTAASPLEEDFIVHGKSCERLGSEPMLLADLDADGISSLVIASPRIGTGWDETHDQCVGTEEGDVLVIDRPASGRVYSRDVTVRVIGEDGLPARGAVAAGDFDGDGYTDLAATMDDEVAVYRGPLDAERDSMSAEGRLDSSPDFEGWGSALDVPGDLDGDGRAELVVGAEYSDVSSEHGGAVLLFRGPLEGLSTESAAAWAASGPQERGQAGAALGHTVDWEALPVLWVAAPGIRYELDQPGLVYGIVPEL